MIICGVDEAGRGPLAGPVVAAAVVLNPNQVITGVKDSKKLSMQAREDLFNQITSHAFAWSIAQASEDEIDQFNILQATLLAMKRAILGLESQLGALPDLAQIDGNKAPQGLSMAIETIVKGDDKVPAISAASILAKVTRDRIMIKHHSLYPNYEFDVHMGYPTPMHLKLLKEHGACPIHRRSFKPVKDVIEQSLFE